MHEKKTQNLFNPILKYNILYKISTYIFIKKLFSRYTKAAGFKSVATFYPQNSAVFSTLVI